MPEGLKDFFRHPLVLAGIFLAGLMLWVLMADPLGKKDAPANTPPQTQASTKAPSPLEVVENQTVEENRRAVIEDLLDKGLDKVEILKMLTSIDSTGRAATMQGQSDLQKEIEAVQASRK